MASGTHVDGAPIPDWRLARRASWRWWLFPIFWALVFCIALGFSTLTLYTRQPTILRGWSGAGLGALLLSNFAAFMLLSGAWLYRDKPVSPWPGMLIFGLQIVLLVLLIWLYSESYVWIALALLYPVVGGLPKRYWPLPLVVLVLVFAAGSLPANGLACVTVATILSIALQLMVNFGIAIGIRLISAQRDQLHTALEQLRHANAELAAHAAQQEELAVLRERTRLARAMHDNLGHALVVMNVKLEAAQLLYAHDPPRGDAELQATRDLIRSTMAELRHALGDLRATPTQPTDLASALQRLARETQARTGVEIVLRIAPQLPALPAEALETFWYVAREALANAEKHAAATHITIAVEPTPEGLRLRVADNGTGVQPADLERPGHYGVVGMRERMLGMGGMLHVERGSDGGTVVEARLPIQAGLEVQAQ